MQDVRTEQSTYDYETYHGILLVLNRLDCDLSKEVVVKHVRRQMRLDRKTLRQELLVEVLPRLLTHEHRAALFVLHWATRAAHHLQDIHDRIVDVSVLLALVELHAHDDDHVARHRQAPRGVLRSDEDLNGAMLE